ncbi:hypothetical protein HPB47_010785, partial [Ixodes persulcatus]
MNEEAEASPGRWPGAGFGLSKFQAIHSTDEPYRQVRGPAGVPGRSPAFLCRGMRRLSVCNSPSGSVILLNESSASSFLPPTSSSIRLAGCEAAEQMLTRFVSRFPKDGRSMMLYGASASSFLYLAKQVARKEPAMEVHYVRMRHFVGRSAGQDSKQMLSNLFAKGQSKVKMVFLYLLDSLYAGSMSIEQLEFAGKVKEGLPAHLKRVLSTSNDWLIVVASARKPWLLPEEVQSNFQKWVYVGLPGFQERIDLLKACIGKMLSSLTDQNYLQLSRMTEEYTYSEIGNVVEEAHLGPFKRIESATHFVKKNERRALEVTSGHGLFAADLELDLLRTASAAAGSSRRAARD